MSRLLTQLWKCVQLEAVQGSLILLGLLILSFSPFVAGKKTLLESARQAQSIMPYGAWTGDVTATRFARTRDPGAPAWQTEPLLALIKKQYFEEKVLPIWNPYQAFGTPLAASMHPQVYYPPAIIQSLFPSPILRNWFILLHLYAAGISAFFYSRLFLSYIPALASGVTSMFAGYYILYITMPHLSVEVLLPVALLAGEYLIRATRFRNVACFALVIYLSLTAGMPESCFLSVSTTWAYLVFRVVTDPILRSHWGRSLGGLLLATIAGFSFSAVLLIPFKQYVSYSFDMHQFANVHAFTGSIADAQVSSIFTYFFPFIYGPGWDNELRNYVGLISFFLALSAIFGISWHRTERNKTLSSITCFFGLLVVALVAKRYGVSAVNWVGRLPIFNLVLFPKYEEAELSISMSILSAIGLERLSTWKLSTLKQAAALGAAFLMVPAAAIISRGAIGKQLLADRVGAEIGIWTLLLPTALLVLTSLFLLATNSGPLQSKFGIRTGGIIVSLGLLLILASETLFSYFVPSYYLWNSPPAVSSNPYLGAPFVDRLKMVAGGYRIFAEDGVLVPEWPSAFNLFDIRSLDAMNYRKYFPFLRSFFPFMRHQPGDELYDRFTGLGDFHFNDSLQQRLLQLSSVKYLVTMPTNSLGKTVVDDIIIQNSGHLTAGKEAQVNRVVLKVGGESRVALFEHPPYNRLPYRVTLANTDRSMHFSYGINPDAFAQCGDGVEFILEAKDPSGKISKLFSSFIDPRHNPSQRRWMNGVVDLQTFSGQSIDLLLTTNGGSKGDICADWAAWSNIQVGNSPNAQAFKLIYHSEVNIFEFNNPLPRASIYYKAELLKNEGQVLASLSSPALDFAQVVLLNAAALDRKQTSWIEELNSQTVKAAESARVLSYKSREVVVKAALDRRGILVLNDSDYPGWKVEVDGSPAKILSSNYLFRGVFLEPGTHLVRFVYNPWSNQLGGSISAVSISSFALLGFFRYRRRPRTTEINE